MIVLDTNVISEPMKPTPAEVVLRWLGAQQPSTVFICAVSAAELLYGIEIMPSGKRRSRLAEALDKMLLEQFRGRILPFDDAAARQFAVVATSRQKLGRPISEFDGVIAAIARTHHAALATRNTRDFEHCGISLIDPWAA